MGRIQEPFMNQAVTSSVEDFQARLYYDLATGIPRKVMWRQKNGEMPDWGGLPKPAYADILAKSSNVILPTLDRSAWSE
ncbi:hypothetical protein CFAM422_003598 [Trichoderma lentiforme]|uniref:Uncharacterized protein n=1 Tax=Trichoderma lentiforme TaxID=1567552 RepID=A0A9P4XJB0_9HYPO|nr:hypothetical protein CFAM422_003598 [Trichoderma lentiforme]